MTLKPSLIKILYRQTLPVSFIATPLAVLYLIFRRELLTWQDPWIALFILLHAIVLAISLGRYQSPAFAYLYTRTYSRDQIWYHKMVVTLMAVLTTWLPAALMLWLKIRSAVQDRIFVSPYFPLMVPREAAVPWFWLFGYALLLPLFHYVWIRKAQPTRGSNGAVLLAIGMVITMGTLWSFKWHPDWFKMLIWITSAIVITTSLTGSFLLHRKLEVRQ